MFLTSEGRLFGLDIQLLFGMVFQIVAILILFFALTYILYDPVRKVLEERKQRIANDILTAKKSRKEAGEYKSRYERKIKGVEEEADRILEEARKKALDKRKEIIAGAKKEEAVILAHAKKEAELEWKRVQDEMKKQMIEGSLLIASRMIAVSLDEEMHRKLIGETLKEMDEGICLSR